MVENHAFEENALLGLFVALPFVMGFGLYLFFGKFKQHRKAGAWRLVTANLLVLLFVLSCVGLGGEVYYRFVYDTTDSFGLTKTTQRWFDRHFVKNAAGVRDSQEYLFEVPPGTRRVTFVGDSFTAGHGVPDVETRFGNVVRHMRPNWDVHVLAHNGMDTGPEIEFLQHFVKLGYELDVVVLVYCLNDISDIVPEWRAVLDRVYGATDPGFFCKHSYFLNTLYFRFFASTDPDVANYFHFVSRNYEGPVWRQQQARFKLLRDQIEANGGKLVVVTFPFLHALGPGYPYKSIHKRLADNWRALNVPHLDLLTIYGDRRPGEVVVNKYDAHPNEAAHAMAAKAIVAFLDEQMAK